MELESTQNQVITNNAMSINVTMMKQTAVICLVK